jgi:hypothetical protein
MRMEEKMKVIREIIETCSIAFIYIGIQIFLINHTASLL